jgi:hypothetical protein
MQNLWFVDTPKGLQIVRQTIQNAIDSNDSAFVVKVNSGEWDCYMDLEAINWLKAHV